MIISPEVEVRPLSERQKEANEIVNAVSVEELRGCAYDMKWRQRFFKSVTRQLKGLGGRAEDYLGAIEVLCQRIRTWQVETTSLYGTLEEFFMGQWPKVKVVPGRDLIQWAKEKAIESPVPLPEYVTGVTTKRRLLYSMAFHLAHELDPVAFSLPRKKVAKILNIDRGNISTIVEWMYDNRLIVPLDEKGHHTTLKNQYFVQDKVCARYRFIGPNAPEEWTAMPGGEGSEY